jgi:S-DNA-T family DNA segregation ATPase FtsK/SpoIIIE
MFIETEARLIVAVRDAIREFIASDDGWTPASEALARLDWSEVRKFFEDSPKSKTQTLGERTEQIFKLLDPDRFDLDDWEYVRDLKVRGANAQRTEEDADFYHKRIREIQEDSSLSAAWERFVYGGEFKCNDFRIGLLECAHRLRKERDALIAPVVLEVIGIESEKLKLTRKNPQACRYFETRYKHLIKSLADVVRFRRCEVFQYSSMIAGAKGKGKTPSGRKADQLTFRVRLASTKREDETSSEIRLVWEFQPKSLLNGFTGDLERLIKFAEYRKTAPLVTSAVELNAKSARGGQHIFSLGDVSSLQSPKRTELGALVPAQKSAPSLVEDWRAALESNKSKGFVSTETVQHLGRLFDQFGAAYTEAVCALQQSDLSPQALGLQADRWTGLMAIIAQEVKAETPRSQLLRPLIRIGLASVQDAEQNVAIALVCPWHPLRLQSIMGREIRFARTIKHLILSDRLGFSDVSGDLFLRDVRQDLSTAGLPEVGLLWRGEDSVPLAQSDELADYSLLEPPTATPQTLATTNENPARTAAQISEIVKSYLALQPHERDNLSIVLYNCDSKSLPTAVVESISASDDDGPNDTTCQIILTHQDRRILAGLYESIASQDSDDDAFYVSEASKDFMSRVRINISVDHGVPTSTSEDKATDIVFCQDVISRHADATPEPASRSATVYAANLILHRWGRKRQLIAGDNSSVVYLTSPAQTQAGWQYLHSLGLIAKSDYAERVWEANDCLVPARRLNFDKPETTQIFQDTHALGNWVVNFDELLDRRILRHRDVMVIRYRQASVGQRNLVISSKSKDTLLVATLQQKLGSLVAADVDEAGRNRLVGRMISEANDISGNLVLRAARRGTNANELIGLVLSRHLVRTEFRADQPTFCFLLDDYAEWLGQTEERVADLLMLVPHESSEGKRLDVIVTEAKFVRFEQHPKAAKESGRQLRDSLNLLTRALVNEPACVDQDLWLDRISDLLLEGIQNLGHNLDILGWRRAIRDRRFKVNVRGHSHVFIHSPLEMDQEGAKFTGIKESHGEQEVFSRRNVQAIIASMIDEKKIPAVVEMRLALSGLPPSRHAYRAVPPPPSVDSPEESPAAAPAGEPPPTPPAPAPATAPAAPSPLLTPPVPPSTGSPMELLPAPRTTSEPDQTAEQAWVADTTRRIRHAFLKRELSAEIVQAKGTPNALLLHFKGSDRLTVGLLEGKLGELRTTDGLDIISVRPGLGLVIVMVARPNRRTLTLAEAWNLWQPKAGPNTEILIAIQENDNSPLYLSPYPQPHTLVAGTTGSGKSVLIQNIILGIAATNSPEEAEVVIIDPKQGLDYMGFEKLPHLTSEIITSPEQAISSLTDLVAEMERRLQLFRKARVQNIDDYLRKGEGNLPRLWVIHDEFGDWTQNDEYSDQVTALVNRLGQMARAAGIYLIFAAQRPDNTIFPMILRSNLGNRLILKVDSAGTSEIALGIKNAGAEKLLGRGHLLALTGTSPELIYAQVPYVDGPAVEQIVASINKKYPR